MHPRPQAAPAPVLRPRDQPGPHSIPLDVPQDGQQMFVALHREALEPSLIQMTVPDSPVRDPPTHRMRVCQPTKEGRHLAVCVRPDGEVPVVRQDAVGQDADRVPLVRLEVGLLAEEVPLADRSVQTWYTCPPGAFRAALGMRKGIPRSGGRRLY